MKRLILVMIVFVMTGCEAPQVSEAERKATETAQYDHKEIKRRTDIIRKIDRETLLLIRKGQQGCPGHVLNGDELNAAVVGKVELNDTIHAPSIAYHSNGRLEILGHASSNNLKVGRYWINQDRQLCEDISSITRLPTCRRLILNSANEISGEVASSIQLGKIKLNCVELKLVDRI